MGADPVVTKRKLEEDGAAGGDDTKHGTGGAVKAEPVEANQLQMMRNEDFSPELLRIYYDRLFPFLQMFRWLSYGQNPKSSNKAVDKDFFFRREFTFVLAGDIYCRYQCFRDAEEYRAKTIAQQPVRMEIGAVFSHPPKNHNTVIKEAYKPVERELVFDIDMDDYDEIRTCCKGSTLCGKCWTFMKCACKTLDRALREDFGFKHLLFVYSGRRGMHCWVCDKAARKLSNEYRSAVAEYLNVVAPGANKARTETKFNGCEEMHPSLRDAHTICERYFKDDRNGVLQGQDILRKGPHLANILATLSSSEKDGISKFVADYPEATSLAIWEQIEKLEIERIAKPGSFNEKRAAKVALKEIVLQYTYPRLDINVSKQMNHLLKSPFVVHPKTGRVCVPIDPSKIDAFNPLDVPTIGRLVEELNRSGDVKQTSLKEYTHFFEVKFLQPLEAECAQELRQNGDSMDF